MRSIFLILFTIGLAGCYSASAQYAIADVPRAFQIISATPLVLHLRQSDIKIPAGGHLQGIQRMDDAKLILTASSAGYSYYLTADTDKIIALHKIKDAPYRHAGGCQQSGSLMMVGIEDNASKDSSDVVVFAPAAHDQAQQFQTVIHRGGVYKRSTAGAVGYTAWAGRYLVVVADWDSRNIDFYRSAAPASGFDSMISFHAPDDKTWCAYQSINLITDNAGRIYLIGFGLDGTHNRADLFEVVFTAGSVNLKSLTSRHFRCDGTSFRYAAGISVSEDGKLSIYSSARNVGTNTAVNIFR